MDIRGDERLAKHGDRRLRIKRAFSQSNTGEGSTNRPEEENFQRAFELINAMQAACRRRLARKPIAEKLRIVEELAERAIAIRSRGAKGKAVRSGG